MILLLSIQKAMRLVSVSVFLVCLFVLLGDVDAQETKSTFPKLQYQRWSGEINVPDPVAVSVDNQGRVFATQTRRRKTQDLDIRANRDWIPDDVGLQSVADKRDFYHKQLAVGGDNAKQKVHVGDHNQDGNHDWRDLTVVSERIFRLVDSDADGTADKITTFAEGFNTEVTGIAAGVMAFDGDVWSTIAPDVWKLTDNNDDGVADSREIMATGFGLHIAYAGHDMHGLTVGPDGKVYWSIGDKGISVKTKEGKLFSYPNQGGVMRCNPDGSDFEVFAHGLRNVQEFAFDQHGNLFGVDNDADQPGERERFMLIVDSMDAGWRCHYQYRGSDFNPWMDEKLWELAGKDHPASIVPPISHYMDGPAGFKFNPGTALSPAYRNFFFVTNAPRGHQYAFRVEVSGDSFKMHDEHEIGSGHALVGLAFGPDGGLYGADWDGGYPLDQKGAVIRIDVDEADRAPGRKEVQQLLATGFRQRSDDELQRLLGHRDMRIRMGAQFALVEHKQTQRLINVLNDRKADRLARLHCVWGLGQLARSDDADASAALIDALQVNDWVIQAQAAKTIGESPLGDSKPLIDLLNHPDLHVRVNAGLGLARHPDERASFLLFPQAALLSEDQHYLRHSIAVALAACAPSEKLAKQVKNPSVMCRLTCVVALRHQQSDLVAGFLSDSSDWVATEAARAIHDDQSINKALSALAQSLDDVQRSEFYIRRAINANFRIGTTSAANRLLRYASNADHPQKMRVDACTAIGQWFDPPVLDRVEGRRRDLPLDSRMLDRESTAEALAKLVENADTPIRVASVVSARKLKLPLSVSALTALLNSKSVSETLRIQSLNSIAESDDGDIALESAIKAAESSLNKLSVRGIEILVADFPRQALGVLTKQFQQTKTILVKQACIAGAAKLGTNVSDQFLASIAKSQISKSATSKLSLDLLEALMSRSVQSKSLASLHSQMQQQLVAAAKSLKIDNDAAMLPFAFSAYGGDKAAGKEIFRTDLRAQCSRCHRIGKKGSKIGPELTKISEKRDANYLLRSIIDPSADIEKKYFSQSVLTDSGQVIRGVVQSENDEVTILADSNGKEIRIPTDEIEDIVDSKVSLMPSMTTTLTPRQVRDVVAYLSSLK